MDYGQMMAEAQKAQNQYIIDHLNDDHKTYTAKEWQKKYEADRAAYYAADHIACVDPDTGRSWIPTYEEWLEGQKSAKDWWYEQHPEYKETIDISELPKEEGLLVMLMMLMHEFGKED